MKHALILLILPLILVSCNDANQTHKNDASIKAHQSITTPDTLKKAKRELRYLFYANGGVIGYFNDGTVTGCPKCDFCKSNIVAMFNDKPYGTYTVEKDGALLIDGKEHVVPSFDTSGLDVWALIDYKWYVKPPQY